jgi:hypothetical protein
LIHILLRITSKILVRFYKGILEQEADRTKYNPMAGAYDVGGLGSPGNTFPQGGRISPSKRTNILDGEIKRAGGIPGAIYNVQHSISKGVKGGDLQLAHLKNDGKLYPWHCPAPFSAYFVWSILLV